MRNLTIYNQDVRKHSNVDEYSKLKSYFCCVNPDNDDFYLLTQYGIDFIPADKEKPRYVLDFERYGDYRPVGMASVYDTVFFAFECGNLVSINTHDDGDFENDLLEDIQMNLHSMSMSPDQDVIVLVNKKGTVITMDVNFQVISKVS